MDSTFRETYCGGIVDVYRPHLVDKGYYYDVNSLYPTAMCRPMPVGKPTLVHLTKDEFLEGIFFGYLEATVQTPVDEYIGLLPIKHSGRLVCPGGSFSGFFFSEELRFALNNKYELLNIGKAYSFQRGENTFKDLIDTLNGMKVTAQLEGKPVLRNIAKLLMNSMYGRFGMHTGEEKHAIVNQDALPTLMKQNTIIENKSLGELQLITYLLNQDILDYTKDKDLKTIQRYLKGIPGQTNVPIAAAVTAYSRMIINQMKLVALNEGLKLYYSDTDSLVVNGPMPPEYLDIAELGKLKLEHTIKEGIFVAPKIYYLKTDENQEVLKCKGYTGKLVRDQYLELLAGNTLDLEVTRWGRSLQESKVQINKGKPYQITPLLNKRSKVIEGGEWIDTRPLILNPVQEKESQPSK